MKRLLIAARSGAALCACLALPFAAGSGCAGHGTGRPGNVFEDSTFGVSFEPPAGWTWAENDGVLGSESFNAPGGATVLYYKAVREDYFYFLDMPGAAEASFRRVRFSYPDFIILTNSPRTVAGLPGVYFEGKLSGNYCAGVLLKNGPDILGFLVHSEVPPEQWKPALDSALASLKVCPTAEAADMVARVKQQLPPVKSMDDARKAIEYGAQLLSARNANVRYFHSALRNLAAAADYLASLSPQPPEYAEVAEYLLMAMNFRYQAYRDAACRLEAALGLGRKSAAKAAADYIMELYPNRKSEQFRYAARKWNQALDLPFDN